MSPTLYSINMVNVTTALDRYLGGKPVDPKAKATGEGDEKDKKKKGEEEKTDEKEEKEDGKKDGKEAKAPPDDEKKKKKFDTAKRSGSRPAETYEEYLVSCVGHWCMPFADARSTVMQDTLLQPSKV
jgi:hypothetical protein